MDYKSVLSVVSSRALVDKVVKDVGNNHQRLNQVLALALVDNRQLAMRAAWVVGLAAEKNPQLMKESVGKMVNHLKECRHTSVIRLFMRVFMLNPELLNANQRGILISKAFDYINDPGMTIGIKFYSIEFLFGQISDYPDLKHELKVSLEHQAGYGTVAYRKRCMKVIELL